MTSLQDITRIVLIGIGATAVMDIWLVLLKGMGVPTPNFGLMGRWAGHLIRGRFAHASIGRAQPIPGELVWGWLAHYAVGIAFAGLLVAFQGPAWPRSPSFLPAIAMGLCTAVAPLFVTQPAMGAGFASSGTATPLKNCFRSLSNHAVFGLGLYLCAVVIERISR